MSPYLAPRRSPCEGTRYELTCPYCGETRKVGYNGWADAKSGRSSGCCSPGHAKAYRNQQAAAAAVEASMVVVECPGCAGLFKISREAAKRRQRKGAATGHCRSCSGRIAAGWPLVRKPDPDDEPLLTDEEIRQWAIDTRDRLVAAGEWRTFRRLVVELVPLDEEAA